MNTTEHFHLEPLTIANYDVLLETGHMDLRRVELLNGLLISMAPLVGATHRDASNA